MIEDESVSRLEKVGEWLKANGEAIYNTKATPVYTNQERNIWFTASKDGKTIYAVIPQTDDAVAESMTISWEGNAPKKNSKIINLATKKAVKYVTFEGKTTITLPKGTAGTNGIALKITVE